MQDQSLFSPEVSKEDGTAVHERDTAWRRIVLWWLRLSGPNRSRFSDSLEDQERLRRSRILSSLFPLVGVAVLIEGPSAIPTPTYWIPIFSLLLLGSISFALNRAALINLSGIFLILAIDTTLTILMVTLPHGIRNSNIPDFDLFLISTLVGGIVLPRSLLPVLAALHMALIVALFAWLPHDPLLTEEIIVNQKGFAYSELSDALLLQVVGAVIAWLNVWSVDRALLRASKAEELARAHQRLNEQAHLLVEQKERLEYGVNVLKEAQARFANGDYKARAHLQDTELAPLAVSFNLLAERLNRIAQAAQEYTRLEQAFQQLFAIQEAVVYGEAPQLLRPTGTLVDRIYPWLKQYYQLRQMFVRCGYVLEKLRQPLVRQRALLSQLSSSLGQTHTDLHPLVQEACARAATIELVEKAQQLCGQIEEQGKLSLQETKLLEQLLRV